MKRAILTTVLGIAAVLAAAPAFAYVPLLADEAALVGEKAMVLTLDLANIAFEGPGDAALLVGTFDYGFNAKLDFRGVLPLWLDTPGDESGVGDFTAGVKWNFAKKGDWEFSLLPYLTLPTGDSDKGLGLGEINLGANLLSSWTQPNNGPWAVDLNFDLYTNNGGSDDIGWAAAGIGHYAIDSKWSVLGGVEFENDGNETAQYLTGGGSFLPSQPVALKAGLKLGIGDNGADSILFFRAVFVL